jgi:hypothetical protein
VSQVNRVERLIINLDTTLPIICNWDECDRRSRTCYQARLHEHPPGWSCDLVDAAGGTRGRHMRMTFCSERHLEYWVHSSGERAKELAARNQGRIYGQLPPGSKLRIG